MLCLVDLGKENIREIFPSDLPYISLKKDRLLVCWLNSFSLQIIHPGRKDLAIIYHSKIKAMTWIVDEYIATHFIDAMEDGEILMTDMEKDSNCRCFFPKEEIRKIWPLTDWKTIGKTAQIIDDFISAINERAN